MLIVIICILLLAAIGGGIYLWVNRARKNLLAKKTKQAESSKLQEEAKPSILDSVVSTVPQDTTSSTASDHPEINASTEATTGEEGAHADGTVAGQPAQPPSQAKYVARFRHAAPAITNLAEALLAAWNQATIAQTAEADEWKQVSSYLHTIYCGNDCRFIDAPADIGEFLTNLNQHFGKQLKQFKNWLAKVAQVQPTAQAASAAFEALRQALRPFPADDIELLPADLQIICSSAHHVLNVSRESIEKKLKEAQAIGVKVEKEELTGKPIKHDRARLLYDANDATFAEGTDEADKRDSDEARGTIIGSAAAAIEAHFPCDKAFDAAAKIFTDLGELDKQSFTFPKKPTPEEITRFLSEVEEWQKQKLVTERLVAPALAAAATCLKDLREAVASLKRTRGRTTPVLTDTARTIDDGLIMAVSKVVDNLETLIQEKTSELAKLSEKKPRVSDPQPKVTSEEEVAVNTLRTTMRTVAFAIAQRSVATAKLAQIQQQEPHVSGFPPHVERTMSFDKYLEKYGDFYSLRGKQRAEHAQWEVILDTVQMAHGARNNKVTESSQALAAKQAEVSKTLGSQPADQLLVVNGMSVKIVELTSK